MTSANVIIRKHLGHFEADSLLVELQSEGISAWLGDQGIVSANPLLSNAVGGIKLCVAVEDEARARDVLSAFDKRASASTPSNEEVCLACGASMSETDQKCAACGWSFLDT